MQTHELKTLPQYWDAVQRGEKTFEVRRDDRGFQKGDVLELVRTEYLPDPQWPLSGDRYGSKSLSTIRAEVTYILTSGQFGIEPGYVVMGIRKLEAV